MSLLSMNKAAPTDFETHRSCHLKSKSEVLITPEIELMSSKKIKNELENFIETINITF